MCYIFYDLGFFPKILHLKVRLSPAVAEERGLDMEKSCSEGNTWKDKGQSRSRQVEPSDHSADRMPMKGEGE